MKQPIISVVMSIYNEPEEWLRESIESILNQSFSDFEFIIINDNPTREFNEVLLREYQKKDNRIAIINNDVNIGLTKSLNKGLEITRGEFIARMDADDISSRLRFEEQLRFFYRNPEVSIVGTSARLVGEKNKNWHVYKQNDFLKCLFLQGNFITHPSLMMKRDVVNDIGLRYDPYFLKSQDYDFIVRASKKVKISNIDKILLSHRVHKAQISTLDRCTQKSYGNKIRIRQLEEAGVQLTDKEKTLYLNFLNNQPLLTKSELKFLFEILEVVIRKLLENHQYNKYYLQISFKIQMLKYLLHCLLYGNHRFYISYLIFKSLHQPYFLIFLFKRITRLL
jgi:glycosyltransferase involved in cell wall biosynthesis